MNTEELLFALLRVAVCGETASEELNNACTDEQLGRVYALASRYDVAHLVGQALGKLNVGASEAAELCKKSTMRAVYRYVGMSNAYETVCQVLEDEKIPFIPLKGSVLRTWYPEPWMRTSSDMDILVRKEQVEEIAALLQEKLQYVGTGGSAHDIGLRSPGGQLLELHYSMIEDFVSKKSSKIMETVWEEAIPMEGKQYHLQLADPLFYYYHMAHMAKHLELGGCGLRPFLDIWILNHRVPYDGAERNKLLESGGLLTFAKCTEKLSEIWFSGAETDPMSQNLQEFVFSGGSYGGLKNRVAVNQAKQGGKFRNAMTRIVLPYDVMKYYYPILQKHKWLTPVYQIVRWCKLLFCGGVKRSVKELQTNADVSREEAGKTKELLDYLGLNTH